MNLQNACPYYTETRALREKARDLYEGGEAVKGRGEKYLYKGQNEDAKDYELRLKRAVLDPWVAKIIDARQAMLWEKEPVRELPQALEDLLPNVDLDDTDADSFFSEVTCNAQIDGLTWVLVDSPQTQGPLVSERQRREMSIRPFFVPLKWQNVLDWQVGADKRLDWAVIAEIEEKERDWDKAGDCVELEQRWIIWTRTEWIRYRSNAIDPALDRNSLGVVPTTRQAAQFEEVARGTNPTGYVPLVAFMGIKTGEFAGVPVARSVFDHVVAIYNKESDLDWFQYLSAHPIPYMVSYEKPEKMDVLKGVWLKARENTQSSMGYLEPTGAGFEAIRDSVRELERRIISIALQQSAQESAQVQAADSQREDRRLFAASIKGVSRLYETLERQCWELAALWAGEPTAGILIKYNRDFDNKTIEAALIRELRECVSAETLPLSVLWDAMRTGELIPPDTTNENLEAELANDWASRAAMFPAGPSGHNQPPPKPPEDEN